MKMVQTKYNWHAAGGCRSDWSHGDLCWYTCKAEMADHCSAWHSMHTALRRNCGGSMRSCECYCKY